MPIKSAPGNRGVLNHQNGKGDADRSPGYRLHYDEVNWRAGEGLDDGFVRINPHCIRKTYGVQRSYPTIAGGGFDRVTPISYVVRSANRGTSFIVHRPGDVDCLEFADMDPAVRAAKALNDGFVGAEYRWTPLSSQALDPEVAPAAPAAKYRVLIARCKGGAEHSRSFLVHAEGSESCVPFGNYEAAVDTAKLFSTEGPDLNYSWVKLSDYELDVSRDVDCGCDACSCTTTQQ